MQREHTVPTVLTNVGPVECKDGKYYRAGHGVSMSISSGPCSANILTYISEMIFIENGREAVLAHLRDDNFPEGSVAMFTSNSIFILPTSAYIKKTCPLNGCHMQQTTFLGNSWVPS